MLLKILNDNTVEEINENTYYSDNKEIQSDCVKYCAVIMHTDDKNNIFSFDQFLMIEISYCCIYIMFEMIQR